MSLDAQVAVKARMWESLRADARHEDTAMESKLNTLERLALSEEPDAATEAKVGALQSEIEEQIRRLQATVMSMLDTARACPPSAEAANMLKHSQRFDEIVAEKNAVLKRLGVDFKKRKERAQLLGSVKHEIRQYQENEELRHLSSENESLRHTQRRLNDILSQADLSRDRLKAQRQTFSNVADKALQIAEKVPFINNILKKIDAKRRREVIILAGLMAVLLFLVFLFW